MNQERFCRAFILAPIIFLIVGLACNYPEKEVPSYITKTNTVDKNDEKIIIESYKNGIADLNYIDSSRFQITDDSIKRALPGLIDFYDDMNGNLKGLALNKKIILEGKVRNVKDTFKNVDKAQTETNFLDTLLLHLKEKQSNYKDNVKASTDPDLKEYFLSTIVLIEKQSDKITRLKKKAK